MKTKYTLPFFAIALLTSSVVTAQNSPVTLTNVDNEVVNGTTIYITAEVGDMTQILGKALNAENETGSSHLVNVKRYEVNVPHGTANYFCWDLCYNERNAGTSPLWIGADPIPMQPGEIANGFHAYHKPMGHTGTATFRYVWYDMNNENDSTWVDFEFDVTEQVGIAEVSVVRGFTAFPNPSVAGNITFNYDLATASAGTQLVVYNMLGERKVVKAIGAAQGTVVLNDGDLSSGVWFAVLERNGKPLATKRVVVMR
ncbi:MAG: T9SS type A sorting domain-containing protein [Flavobacteriales bacterium]